MEAWWLGKARQIQGRLLGRGVRGMCGYCAVSGGLWAGLGESDCGV